MSTSQTKIFGMTVGVDPKVIVLLLLVLAGVIYYFTSSSSTTSSSGSSTASGNVIPITRPAQVNPGLAARAAAVRRAQRARMNDATLKLVAVDGSRGDVDPTLRLTLLDKVRAVQKADSSRNLFDADATAASSGPALPTHVPKIVPGPVVPPQQEAATTPPPAPFSIPLKYYGFVKAKGNAAADGNRGFFMDGDDILVGGEGALLEKKYLIVALTPNSARLEDVQAKQGQELTVTPEAPVSQ